MLAMFVALNDGDVFVGSRETTYSECEEVVNQLKDEFNDTPDNVLLIQNDEVVSHWVLGRDYN